MLEQLRIQAGIGAYNPQIQYYNSMRGKMVSRNLPLIEDLGVRPKGIPVSREFRAG